MSLRDFLRFLIIACIFITPFICLFVASSMFFPFITGKNFAFRILVEVMLGAWLLLMFIDSSYRPKFSWILGAAGAFVVVLAAADFLGVNPYRSFWSNYERMEGLVAQIHFFLYFLIAGTIMQAEKLWLWFFRTSLGVSMIVAVNAFSQLAGKSEIHQGSTRLDATFGNATYLAVYALFHIFLAAFLYAREGGRNSFRWLYLATGVVNFTILYFTQTRGALLGVIGGSFIAFLLVALFDRERTKLRKYALGGVIGLAILVGAFIMQRDAAWIQNQETLKRMADISLSDPTTQSRFMIWNMSWEGFKERPILGWGQDNFLYVFSQHYNPKMWNQEPWFDRSHDVFFDWLIAGGALGLLAYLSLFGAALYYLWFGRRFSILERSILTGMLAGYFIQNIFVFDNLTSYIVFFGVLAYLHSQHAKESKVDVPQRRKDGELEAGDMAIAGVLVFCLTAGLIYFLNVRNITANRALIASMQQDGVLVDDGKGGKRVAIADVLDLELFGSGEAREQLAQMALQAADPRVPEDLRLQFFNLTANAFEDEIARDPENLRTRSFAALFYARYGQFTEAFEHFNKAIEISPKRQSIYLDLGLTHVAMGNYEEAERVTKIAYELEPAYPEAGVAYAAALIYSKKYDVAELVIAGLSGGPQKFDSRILNAYGNNGQYQKVVALVNEKIALGIAEPGDYLMLAASYSELGRKDDAISAVEKAVSLDPGLKEQGEQYIKEIREGK